MKLDDTPKLFLNSNGSGPNMLFYGSSDTLDTSTNNCSLERIKQFISEHQYVYGALSYDFKNKLEALKSQNPAYVPFPDTYLSAPLIVIDVDSQKVVWSKSSGDEIDRAFEFLDEFKSEFKENHTASLYERLPKERYLEALNAIKEHIQLGDIYEANLCQEFKLKSQGFEVIPTFLELNKRTNAPYACLFSTDKVDLLCGSPELFLEKRGPKVISMPIKGTRKRSTEKAEDERLKLELKNDTKERAENIMITDLVRNDLSKTALAGSVKVEELCAIHSFKTVHQMISTVSSKVAEETHPMDIICDCFPMGSMTGAPKIRAMQLIDQYEIFRRGLYSGAVGYFGPDGDFTFNVVIRSIVHERETGHLSVSAGGAITALSDPEAEYDETLLKAQAMLDILGVDIH